jgi:hypothetical protein
VIRDQIEYSSALEDILSHLPHQSIPQHKQSEQLEDQKADKQDHRVLHVLVTKGLEGIDDCLFNDSDYSVDVELLEVKENLQFIVFTLEGGICVLNSIFELGPPKDV